MPLDASAAGILLTHGDRALFLKRSDKSRDHAGEWCCPGGSLEDGETPEQAARRELGEETGLTGLLTGNVTQIDEGNGFVTFQQSVDDESTPTLNDEHTEAMWAQMSAPPQPLHPGVASTLQKLRAVSGMDRREYDSNNWFEVLDNPISTVGVYPYRESSVIRGGDRNKMVNVFRPAEELGSPECVNSFKLMPWTDDHPDELFGDTAQGYASTEEKGVRGVIGEKVYFKDGTLYGNLKVFSETLARKIAAGKRELSCGYYCQFLPSEGVYEGTPYQYVQSNMRGNHISSVDAGRMGSAVRVLDAAEEPCLLAFALDLKESPEEFATDVAGTLAAAKGNDGSHPSEIEGITMSTKTAEEIKDAADRQAARDSARSARDSMRAKDSMSSEEEEGMDAKECAEDAEEEKDDAKDESKEAKDRGRARDRRAGARDARKGARDSKSARDAKAALDAANKGKGMDAAAVTALVDGKLAAMDAKVTAIKVPTAEEIVAQVRPAIRKEEAAKASLYGRVSPIIGAFDHAEMTHVEMANYSLDKLGAPKGATDPVGALDFYLAGRSQTAVATTHALDAAPAEGSFMAKYLNS